MSPTTTLLLCSTLTLSSFHQFFTHIDGYRESSFLYFSSKGLAAAKYEKDRGGNKESTALIDGSDSEAEAGGAQEG